MAIKNYNKRLISEINITPLVDVMMVLLIIFMVTVPMMKHGVDVNLPATTAKPIQTTRERLIITIDKTGKVYVDELETPLDKLSEKLQYIFANRPDREVFLRADAGIPYGEVATVMAELRNAGVTKLGMITEPVEKKK